MSRAQAFDTFVNPLQIVHMSVYINIYLLVGSSPSRGIQPIFSEEYVERGKKKMPIHLYQYILLAGVESEGRQKKIVFMWVFTTFFRNFLLCY